MDSYFIHRYVIIKYRSSSIKDKIHQSGPTEDIPLMARRGEHKKGGVPPLPPLTPLLLSVCGCVSVGGGGSGPLRTFG